MIDWFINMILKFIYGCLEIYYVDCIGIKFKEIFMFLVKLLILKVCVDLFGLIFIFYEYMYYNYVYMCGISICIM